MATRRDNASWMFLHDGMPDHPKIEALSDRAFRNLIELWCYCSRHLTDGYVTEQAWRKRTTPKVRQELIGAGLVDVVPHETETTKSRRDHAPNGVVMHDYLDWQRSAAEAAEFSSTKQRAGTLGNHIRWHVNAGRTVSDCKFCADDDPGQRSHTGSHEPSHVRSHSESQMRSQTDRTAIAEKRREEVGSVRGERPVSTARASRRPPADPDQMALRTFAVHNGTSSTRCAVHADWPAGTPVPSCGDCADARRAHTDAERRDRDERATAAAQRLAAIAACPTCDHLGMRDGPHGPDGPRHRCTHQPAQPGDPPPAALRAV